VELVEDKQWGTVLVAQRDFAPGELVIRSAGLVEACGAAEYIKTCVTLIPNALRDSGMLTELIDWATSSPRRVWHISARLVALLGCIRMPSDTQVSSDTSMCRQQCPTATTSEPL
jgi:hypothetical protein